MASGRRPILYTLGHSTRTRRELLAILRAFGIETLVDIRHFTRSRANPQFNESTLAPYLRKASVEYVWIPALGGRRGRSKEAPPERNAGWDHAAFKNYADYAETDAFAAGLDELLARAERSTCAILCAEAVWWRCHRRIVADYAMSRGFRVFHIFTETKADPAKRTPFAKVDRRRGTLRYPRSP